MPSTNDAPYIMQCHGRWVESIAWLALLDCGSNEGEIVPYEFYTNTMAMNIM
jgi:hypothetical protein